MSCRDCNTTKVPCECPVKDLSTNCVIYTGDNTENIGILKGDSLTTVVNKIDERVAQMQPVTPSHGPDIINVGEGSRIYAGKTIAGDSKIRTLVAGSGIELRVDTNDITITSLQDPQIKNKGEGVEIYKGKDSGGYALISTIKGGQNVTITDTPEGIEISASQNQGINLVKKGVGVHTNETTIEGLITKGVEIEQVNNSTVSGITETSNQVTIKPKTLNVTNIGTGSKLLTYVNGADDVSITSKSVTSKTVKITDSLEALELTIPSLQVSGSLIMDTGVRAIELGRMSPNSVLTANTETQTALRINPKDIIAGDGINVVHSETDIIVSLKNDTGIPDDTIYVNNNFIGFGEGTKDQPFTTIDEAIAHYKGTGTSSAPQRLGTKIKVTRGNYTITSNLAIQDIVLELEQGTNVSKVLGYLIDNSGTGVNKISILGGKITTADFINSSSDLEVECTSKVITGIIAKVNAGTLFIEEANIKSNTSGSLDVSATGAIKIYDSKIDIQYNNALPVIANQNGAITLIGNKINMETPASNMMNIVGNETASIKLIDNRMVGNITALVDNKQTQPTTSSITIIGNKCLMNITGNIVKMVNYETTITGFNIYDNVFITGKLEGGIQLNGLNSTSSVYNFIENSVREDLTVFNTKTLAENSTVKKGTPYRSLNDKQTKEDYTRETKV